MHLVLALRRAGTSHDDHFVAADADLAAREHGIVRLECAARELVRLADTEHLVYAVEHLDQSRIDLAAADDTQYGASGPARAMHVHAELDQVGDDLFHLRIARAFFHHDNHDSLDPVSRKP